MKKSLSILIILTAVLTAFARPVKRIKFPKGATQVTVKGELKNYRDVQEYVIRLRENQTFKIDQIDGEDITGGAVSISVTDPDGENVDDYAADCHSYFRLPKTKAGDYKIRVFECLKGDEWNGTFKIKVSAVDNK